MSKIRCIVVDDEELARTLIKQYIGMLDVLEFVGECSDGVEVISFLEQQEVDLLFLDIQMPRMKGTQLAELIKGKSQVIFTTAYAEYAVESYDLEATDYLLKPIRFERFVKAIGKVKEKWIETQGQTGLTLTLKSGYDLHKVKLQEILYIEGMKEYVAYHTPDKRIMVYQSLKSLEQSLPQGQFMRVHRSYIVNLQKVEALVNKALVIGEKQVPVGERYMERVKKTVFS